ncbi:hypothetical protein XA68_14604 [Ophiocordyceps unilateralis]|uniref:Apple domain-containing protein n=1 Tax=Ophiocordyceps unilateralis TaxID=268505 RepID=A0A2A9PMS4_OPHUN|nr:hypothetical protein XA68_14604 [Ophiocordyceps unilateralis]
MKVAFSSVVAVLAAAEYVVAADKKYSCPGDKEETMVTDLAECATRCAANDKCLHSTLVDGNCGLKKAGEEFQLSELSTWMFVEKVTTTTQPQTDDAQKPIVGDKTSYSCPTDNKERYTTNGITYEFRCNTGHSKTHWKTVAGSSTKECADICAKEPECYSCDFTHTGTQCALKKAPAALTGWTLGDAWWPVVCPDTRATTATKEPEIASDLNCAANDGKIWEGSDGTWFYLQCCTDTGAATVVDQGSASSHKDCVEKCVRNKECKRLYGNSAFSTIPGDRVHYAFVTDPPTKAAKLTTSKRCSTECPDAHGQLYQSVTGENFLMSCYHRYGTNHLKIDRRDSYESCIAACDLMPECRSVEYEPRTKKCFYGTNAEQATISAKAFLSAHSLGCAGSCSSCKKKGCDKKDNKPLPADAARCDDDHGKLLVAGGTEMRMNCQHCWHSADSTIRKNPTVKSLADCAKLCGQDPYCHGANWMGPKIGCNLHPRVDADGNGPKMKRNAKCDSVTPLTRSLADYPEDQITDSGNTERDW